MSVKRLRARLLKIWEHVGAVSVRTKIFGIVLGSTLLLSLTFALQVRSALHNTLEIKTQEQGVSVARDVAARATDLILINDLYALHELLMETQANYNDVRYVFVLDPTGHVLAHTFGEGFPADLLAVNQVPGQGYQNTTVLRSSSQETVWDVAVPIFEGKAGTARVGISDVSVRQTLSTLTWQLILMIAGVLTASLLAATALTWILTQPILTLVSATRAIAKGDFSPRVARWANDEIGDLSIAFNQMAEELGHTEEIRQEREDLRNKHLVGVITAQEDERRRIARELHDSTSQALTSLIVGLRNLESVCDKPELHGLVEQLRLDTGKTLEDVHALAMQLRPSVLDDLGLSAAVERLVQEWRERHNIIADVLVQLGEARLSGEIETALYRIIQEAFTNIARHAEATAVSLLVERKASVVTAIIEDDGCGFDMQHSRSNGRLGLLGMQERAELLGGEFTIETGNGKGTSVFVTIPLAQEGMTGHG